MSEFSDRRLYLGNLPKAATKKEVEDLFKSHGHGEIVEIKLMNGFGFVEYGDPADARDVVPAFHGKEFMGERLTVQFARGSKSQRKEFDNTAGAGDRPFPRPRRTGFKMNISGMASDTSWQDLKDFARKASVDVVYSEVSRERDGRGMVEFETAEDLKTAIRNLDGTDFKGHRVACTADSVPPGRDRDRSRSPGYRHREYSPGRARGYRESPTRGYPRERTPPARGYREYPPRERSPRREPYYAERRERERERFSPPPIHYSRRPHYEPDEPPYPRSYPARSSHSHYDDGYPSKRYEDERYATNGRAYDDRRPPSPSRRQRSPRRYEDDYRRH